ncbi:MAG: hypothetical protein ABW208_18400 [Pyrinomonadaceae bacterium]
MKPQHTTLLPAAAACAALLFVCASAPTPACAQAAPQPHRPPPPAQSNPNPRAPSVRERQLMMDEMSREMGKGTPPRKSEELRLSEIAEDYRDLQQVNNKMMSATMRAPAPDYELINKSVADIRRRAERLRENLALPAPEAKDEKKTEPKPAEDSAGMKAALLALDRSIMSFVRSPLFKNTDVLDAEAAARAGRDLADVIERSRLAAKDAERLGKRAKN